MKLLFYVLIVAIIVGSLYLHYHSSHPAIKETMIPNLSAYQNINNLSDMRNFLEELYTICYTSPNSVVSSGTQTVKNTPCYQISILGTYIDPILGNIASQPMELLFSTYGSPKPSPMGGSQSDPVPGIITSTQDYVMLLQLYIAGKNLVPFSSGKYPIWSQDLSGNTTVTTDICLTQDQTTSNIVGYAVELYKIAKTSLQHFHNQITNANSITYGDTADTSTYSEGMTDYYSEYITAQCANGKKTVCSGAPVSSDFYAQYVSTTYTDFNKPGAYSLQAYAPPDTTTFRVLLIGASGGGGNAHDGKYNNNGPDQAGGGGGGGGGGGISASTTYRYTNNYQVFIGAKGNGGRYSGQSGNSGGESKLYDTSLKQTVLTAMGGGGGGGGNSAVGNSGGKDTTRIGNQGNGGGGGYGLTRTGNSGQGDTIGLQNGGSGGTSSAWSSSSEVTIKSRSAGVGGNCDGWGSKARGNSGSAGTDGFVRVYWIH